MASYLEKRISQLRKRQFSPADPRTPSIVSVPGRPLSLDNEAKTFAASQRDLDYDHNLRLNPGSRAYWSDDEHLADKLRSTIEFVALHEHVSPGQVAEKFAIVKGTGEVVTLKDGAYHYVEIMEGEQNQLYISPKATLPEAKVPFVTPANALGIV